MPNLLLKATKTTPLIWFEPEAGICVLAGRSLPENAPEFYGRLLEHMDRLSADSPGTVKWEFKLTYFNTSSTKGIYEILRRIKARMDAGAAWTVVWDVEEDDEFMREAGENFTEVLAMPMEFREVTEETAQEEVQRLAIAMSDRS